MESVGLTFDEYLELKLRRRAGTILAGFELPEDSPNDMFPMAVTVASSHLRTRGYDSHPAILDGLILNRIVNPSDRDVWTQADVDAAADHLEECEIFTPYAAMCQVLGCRYADYLRALREAADRESAKYGGRVRDDDQLFVLHRVPPRGVVDDEGQLVDIKPADISFTLCEDIRERLERGEVV